jgi:hypothetical protein
MMYFDYQFGYVDSWAFLGSWIVCITGVSDKRSRAPTEYFSCIQLPKTKLFQRVHYKFLCMEFQAIPSKFSCATFQNLQNTSHIVTLFLAHEDIVVGFVIFLTKLSTPWLACFICSSLILQESSLDHYNFKKKKEKRHSFKVCDCGQAPEDSVSHGLWKRRLGGVPNYIKVHVDAFFNNSEPLSTCLVWKITRTLLPFIDRNNHLSKQFLSLFYKWKALAHDKSLLPSAKGLSFLL